MNLTKQIVILSRVPLLCEALYLLARCCQPLNCPSWAMLYLYDLTWFFKIPWAYLAWSLVMDTIHGIRRRWFETRCCCTGNETAVCGSEGHSGGRLPSVWWTATRWEILELPKREETPLPSRKIRYGIFLASLIIVSRVLKNISHCVSSPYNLEGCPQFVWNSYHTNEELRIQVPCAVRYGSKALRHLWGTLHLLIGRGPREDPHDEAKRVHV